MRRFGGSAANEQLTAIVGAVLFPLLAAEGATLLNLRSLLNVHAFVGMLLLPVVVLKIASAGWRMVRYYAGSEEYVLRGPPQVLIRAVVAPLLVASTVILFGTGVALLVLDRTEGTLVGLHKASFFVWVGMFAVHVLTRAGLFRRALRRPVPRLPVRLVAASLSVVAGVALATLTLPAVDRLQDDLSGRVGFDSE